MKLSKIPKHIWLGVLLPLVLVSLGAWQWWPEIEEYRARDERGALGCLTLLDSDFDINMSAWEPLPSALANSDSAPDPQPVGAAEVMPKGTDNYGYKFIVIWRIRPPKGKLKNAPSSFYCAYPANYDWRHKRTFITAISYRVLSTDNGGKPITEWPTEEEIAERFTLVEQAELFQ